jgi:hypothetical protein
MLKVDEHQFQLGYTPIACGIMFAVVGSVAGSIIMAILWLVRRGN